MCLPQQHHRSFSSNDRARRYVAAEASLPVTTSGELEDVRQQSGLTARVNGIEGLRAMMNRDLAGGQLAAAAFAPGFQTGWPW
jgi:hypothetical protein